MADLELAAKGIIFTSVETRTLVIYQATDCINSDCHVKH